MPDPVRVASYPSLAQTPAHVWSALSGPDELFRCRAWFEVNEGAAGSGSSFLVAFQDQRPLALCPAFTLDKPGGYAFFDLFQILGGATLFGRAGVRQLPAWQPHLAVAIPYGYCSPLLWAADADASVREAAAAALLEALSSLARSKGAAAIAFLYMPAGDPFLAWLSKQGLPCGVVYADSVLSIRGQDWEGYLRSLGSHRRRRVLAELRASERGGLRVVPAEPNAETPRLLAEMEADLMARHGYHADHAAWVDWYVNLFDRMSPRSTLYFCMKDDRPVGFSLFLREGTSLHAKATGYRYGQLAADEYAYFVTTYYHPIRGAMSLAAEAIHFGGGSYAAKLLRGCRLVPLYAAVVPLKGDMDVLRGSLAEFHQQAMSYHADLHHEYGRNPEEDHYAPG